MKMLCVTIDLSVTFRHNSGEAVPIEEENLAQVAQTCLHPELM